MGRSSKTIDSLDVAIYITKGASGAFGEFLKNFTVEYTFLEIEPRWKGDFLYINSNDLVAFLGYVNPKRVTEFELRQFLNEAQKSLDQCLLRATSLDYQSHYKWCMAALKNFVVGRYLPENDE